MDIHFPLFEDNGIFNGEIPQACVRDCTQPGVDASPYVRHWVDELEFNVPREAAQAYLRGFGAWDDLEDASDETLARRVLWIACNDIDETGSWIGMVE